MRQEIICSGMTGGEIYVANVDGRGNIRSKTNVTQQVINAVVQHMDITKQEYECRAGDLIFKPKAIDPTESA